MNKIFLIAIIFFAACCTTKKQASVNETGKEITTAVNATTLPSCIVHLIDSFKKAPVQNPPASIYSYTYKDSTVYYVPAKCCDFYSNLFNSNCNLLGHPDGGFTGKGDRSLPGFLQERTNEKLLWQDERGNKK